ncbi:MAG: ABC transporter substrate-binding protein [bacterium]
MRRRWMLAGLTFGIGMGLLCFLACLRKGKVHSPDTMVIGTARDWRVSDIWSYKGFNGLVFETLISQDQKGGYLPLIAQSWEKSEDGRDYTFRIRDGISFSDGTRVTAYHVKESFEMREKRKKQEIAANGQAVFHQSTEEQCRKEWLDEIALPPIPGDTREREKSLKFPSCAHGEPEEFLTQLSSLTRWSAISSIEIIDERTVCFHLYQPYTLFLDELATPHISPVVKPSSDEKVTGFIGTGPYTIREYSRARHILLAKNPYYWQGEVKIPHIMLKVIPDPGERIAALEAGDIDLIGLDCFDKVPLEMVPRLRAAHCAVEKLSSPDPSVHSLVLNYQKEPFTDIRVREAIYLAIDQHTINSLIHDASLSINGPVPQNHFLYNPQVRRRRSDVSASRQLLAEAGWKDRSMDGVIRKGGEKFSVTLSWSSFDPVYEVIADLIQAQLKMVGIEVKLQPMEFGVHAEKMRSREFEMALWPQVRYPLFYYTGQPFWFTVYQSPELDEAFSIFLHSNDPEESRKACCTTQELITKSYVQPFFFEVFTILAWNTKKIPDLEPLPLKWNPAVELWKAGLTE